MVLPAADAAGHSNLCQLTKRLHLEIHPIIRLTDKPERTAESEIGRPAQSGEVWLGRDRSEKRRLWERLNPRHRKELRMLAGALADARAAHGTATVPAGCGARRIGTGGATNCGHPGRGSTPDTPAGVNLASAGQRTHTLPMSASGHRKLHLGLVLLAAGVCTSAVRADEIRLKDGKKLYGVIVAYEDNMFKVKTDFGYVLVEKDKIASIIPDTPAQAGTKGESAGEAKATPAAERAPTKKEKAAAIMTNASARPEIPAASKGSSDAKEPALKTATSTPKTTLVPTAAPPPPPKEEPAANREEIQGNLYINHEFGFRMYKAPSWKIIDGAGQALPNAIVAMGTSSESTLLVVGHEKSRTSLEAAAQALEKRLQDVYENYRLISQRKTTVGGQPAVEYRYGGLADEHDWSGTLTVVAHAGEFLTVLGMTYADTDLIQIQENVITRAIASLDFDVK